MPTINPSGQTITQYNVQTGGANNLLNNVAPSAASNIPLISNGAAAHPAFGTASVAGGGTGATTLTGLLTGNGTSAIVGTAITQYNVITGGASNLPNSVAPSATSGVPVISQGAASQPVFGTAVVAGGGTGATSFTAYAVLTGGTTSTNPIQSIASVGTASQVLTSNGPGALPTFQNSSSGSGALILLETQTISSPVASVEFLSLMSSTYLNYILYVGSVFPVTNSSYFCIKVSSDNGASYAASGYTGGTYQTALGNVSAGSGSPNAPAQGFLANLATSTSTGISGSYNLNSFTGGGTATITGDIIYEISGPAVKTAHTSIRTTTTNINAIKLFCLTSGFAATNIKSGVFSLYGIVQ